MEINSCEGCVFAQPVLTDDEELIAKCHRYPPQIYMNADGEMCQGHPDATMGCGEYKAEEIEYTLKWSDINYNYHGKKAIVSSKGTPQHPTMYLEHEGFIKCPYPDSIPLLMYADGVMNPAHWFNVKIVEI